MIQKSNERRIFESLCLEPEKRGFSYDPVLLVDVDHAFDFDEAVIRLTTKCNSIVTQLRTLGHEVEEFSVMSSKVGSALNKAGDREEVSSPEIRNLKVMEDKWKVMKRKNYSGMVAVARISRSSIPRNGSGGKYSVQTFTQALMNHIQAYFMFQSYNADFLQWMTGGPYELEDADEYLMYLVYRLHHTTLVRGSRKRGLSEVDKLESWGMYSPASRRRRRYTSGESSISSSSIGSSASSTPSGGPAVLTAPVTRSATRIPIPDLGKSWDKFSPPSAPTAPSTGSTSSRPSTPSQPSTPQMRTRRSKSPDSDSTLLLKSHMSLRRRASFSEGSGTVRRPVSIRPRRKLSDQQAPHTD